MPDAARRPDEKRRGNLDDETEGDRKFLEPFRMLVRPPADHGRERLRPIVVVERGQIPPRFVVTGQLHDAGHEQQFEKKQLEQKQSDTRKWRGIVCVHPPAPGREEEREKTGFKQEDVPLETEERLAGDRERQIKNEKKRE